MDDKTRQDIEYAALRFHSGLTSASVRELFGSGIVETHRDLRADNITALISKMCESDQLSNKTREAADKLKKNTDAIRSNTENYIEIAERTGMFTVSEDDPDYPYLWKVISGMPKVVFGIGDRSILSACHTCGAAAMVGSRTPGRYSLYATEQFASHMAREGIVIVSGMALGIDRKSHESALDAGGKSIAFMPCGADQIYPFQNADIYDRMKAEGLILSEMPPGRKVIKQYFPSRNRLIAGLSDVCLIMEAGLYSGTLHTASFAANQGKDVFVLPNNIYVENCLGGLMLLKDGAEVLIRPEIVEERIKENVSYRYTDPKPETAEDPEEEVVELLKTRPLSIDDLCARLTYPYETIAAVLTGLELAMKVEQSKGKYVLTIC